MSSTLSSRSIGLARKVPGLPRSHRWMAAIVAGFALAACGGGGGDGPGGGGGGGGGPAGPNPPASGSTVTIQDNAFNPASLPVAVGTTVRWVNSGAVVHNTISNTGVWTSANLNPNAEFSRTFTTAGTFPYQCTLHPGMTGTIVVGN